MMAQVEVNDGPNYLKLIGEVINQTSEGITLKTKEGEFTFGFKEVNITPLISKALTSSNKTTITATPAKSKMAIAKEIYLEMMDGTIHPLRYRVLARYKSELDLTGATAATYYQKIKTELMLK